jgi:endo-1,4-beta-xylanase
MELTSTPLRIPHPGCRYRVKNLYLGRQKMNLKINRNIINFLLLAGLSLAFLACGEKETPTVPDTGVTVSPKTATVAKGGTQEFTAKVNGANGPVTWSIVETGKNSGTTINNGLLTVAAAETLTSLTVKATSTEDTTKSDTATVKISSVTDVTVSPASPSVAKGTTQQFSATVTGTNGPAQTVTWSVTGGITGTSITANGGLLTVASGETAATLTVKATSTADTTKSGTTTVTVTEPPALSGTVSISGIKEIDQSLTVITTDLGGSGTITYQWKQCNTATDEGTNIGSNSPNYKLVTADLSKYIKVIVTRSGNPGSVTSDAVGPVRAALVIPTAPLNPNASDAQTFTSNSGGNKSLTGSSYGYEMWTNGGNNNKLIWFGPNQGGGAAFKAEWNNPDDFLGRIGYYWGNGGQFTQYKNMYADFNYTRSGRGTGGKYYSYIGIYGWARNPSAAKDEEKLIEYYIVEDWFGNDWVADTSPMTKDTTGGNVVSSYTLDGATYSVIKNVRTNQPSIDGNKTFTQYFSIRQTLRKTGTISITEHFKKWDALNMKLGNMYECKFLVEAGGGTGWLEFTWLKLSQEENPR